MVHTVNREMPDRGLRKNGWSVAPRIPVAIGGFRATAGKLPYQEVCLAAGAPGMAR